MKNPFTKIALFCLILGMLGWSGCDLLSSGPREIKLDSDPTGAFLVINGKEAGRTPYILKDPVAGRYLLQLRMDGREETSQVVEINAESPPEIVIKLAPVQALVLIESMPSGAEVMVDGVFRGKAPLFQTDMSWGTHKVAFKLEGYDPRETELKIENSLPKLCAMNMRPNFVVLEVDSNPQGAAVVIDGIHKGTTPCKIEDVLIGGHVIKVLKDGFREYREDLNLSRTGTFPVVVQLKEQLATIDVTSTPTDARVTVNGEFKGRTPLQVGGLRDGIYTNIIEKASYETLVELVEIRDRRDAKVDVTLEKLAGTLILDVKPLGANILVDNEMKGNAGVEPLNLDLMPGTYTVEINKGGFHTHTFKIQMEPRKTVSKAFSLSRVWAKDTVVTLKGGRVKEGMLESKLPNGDVRLQTAPGIFENYTATEVETVTPLDAKKP